jgi:hypothetical protein
MKATSSWKSLRPTLSEAWFSWADKKKSHGLVRRQVHEHKCIHPSHQCQPDTTELSGGPLTILNSVKTCIGWLVAGVAIAFASVELGIYQECEQNANPESSEVRFCVI